MIPPRINCAKVEVRAMNRTIGFEVKLDQETYALLLAVAGLQEVSIEELLARLIESGAFNTAASLELNSDKP